MNITVKHNEMKVREDRETISRFFRTLNGDDRLFLHHHSLEKRFEVLFRKFVQLVVVKDEFLKGLSRERSICKKEDFVI